MLRVATCGAACGRYRTEPLEQLSCAPCGVSRASGSRRQRDDPGVEKGAKRLKVEPKAEHGTGANGALVPPPPQHLVQHGTQQPVSTCLQRVRFF